LQSTVCLKRGDAVLREALCSRGEQSLLSRLERLPALGDGVCPIHWAGLCHGDLIGDNLLRDRGGRLWPVDWDAAALAPREL
jgi:tRNA A-37 threonylcarbamoyl transferase component Bud32